MSFPIPFGPNFSKTKAIAATTTSANVALDPTDVTSIPSPTSSGTYGGHTVMRIVNAGPNTAFLRWGVGAAATGAAVITDMPMLAGTIEVFTKADSVDTIAAICATGTASISITCGEGA